MPHTNMVMVRLQKLPLPFDGTFYKSGYTYLSLQPEE